MEIHSKKTISFVKKGNALTMGETVLPRSHSSRDYRDRLQIIGFGFATDLDDVLRILSAYRGHPVPIEAILMRHMGEKFAHIGINQPRNRSTKK